MSQRVQRLRDEASRPSPRASLLEEIEDALSAGYVQALEADAWSIDTERRLHELMTDAGVGARGSRLRALAREHARFESAVISLRRELAALRGDRDRLYAAGPSRSR